ncbi:MAG: DUF5596 domain-containing protein [Clostridia bacterium]|nr:DUF5596 domain-containing protein [Clostridia bacterium]
MTNQELYDLIELPAPVRAKYEAWDTQGLSVLDDELFSRLVTRSQWADAYKGLEARLGEDPGHVRLLWEELNIAVRQYPRWQEKGIPLEIYRDTIAFATRYLKDGLAAYGDYCFTAGWWFPRHLALELFRLGSLEFELFPAEEGPRVYLHIPTDASLAPEAIDDSIRRFRDFAARFYPEWKDADLYCDSWMISPAVRPLLRPGSHILAFQDRFQVLSVNTDSMGAVNWVFPGHKEPYDQLPEGSSLQKSMKAFLVAGGKPGWAEGRMK